MLYGQELDKQYEQQVANEQQLRELHAHKTGALIIAAVELGCAAAGGNENLRQALHTYAAEVGLVFQIVDDILDVTSTTEELGKPVGSVCLSQCFDALYRWLCFWIRSRNRDLDPKITCAWTNGTRGFNDDKVCDHW